MKKGVKMSLFSHNKKDKEKDKEKEKGVVVNNNNNQNNGNGNHNNENGGDGKISNNVSNNGKGSPTNEMSRVEDNPNNSSPNHHHHTNSQNSSPNVGNKPKLVFHCQQAQGSPTGLISGFSNVKELYQKIANCYGFTADDVSTILMNDIKVDTVYSYCV